MAAPFEADAHEAMEDGDAGNSTQGVANGAQLQLETSTPRRKAATGNPRHEPSLLGLPAEIRLMIYDLLTAGDRDNDLDIFPMVLFSPTPRLGSPIHYYPDHFYRLYAAATRHPQPIRSWSWIHTCRAIFEEGRWTVIKTHIVTFNSEGEFYCHEAAVLKTIRSLHFPGFHLSGFAERVETRLERSMHCEFVRNLDKRRMMGGYRKPERALLLWM